MIQMIILNKLRFANFLGDKDRKKCYLLYQEIIKSNSLKKKKF